MNLDRLYDLIPEPAFSNLLAVGHERMLDHDERDVTELLAQAVSKPRLEGLNAPK